jgi:hypothetical protein
LKKKDFGQFFIACLRRITELFDLVEMMVRLHSQAPDLDSVVQ